MAANTPDTCRGNIDKDELVTWWHTIRSQNDQKAYLLNMLSELAWDITQVDVEGILELLRDATCEEDPSKRKVDYMETHVPTLPELKTMLGFIKQHDRQYVLDISRNAYLADLLQCFGVAVMRVAPDLSADTFSLRCKRSAMVFAFLDEYLATYPDSLNDAVLLICWPPRHMQTEWLDVLRGMQSQIRVIYMHGAGGENDRIDFSFIQDPHHLCQLETDTTNRHLCCYRIGGTYSMSEEITQMKCDNKPPSHLCRMEREHGTCKMCRAGCKQFQIIPKGRTTCAVCNRLFDIRTPWELRPERCD